MTTRVLALVLALGMSWVWPAQGRAQSVPPLVTVYPIDEETMPGVMGTGTAETDCPSLGDRDPFHAGSLSFQAMVGYFSKGNVGAHGPAVDYAPIAARIGYVANTPAGEGCFRGCFELLLEAEYSPIIRTFGNYFSGSNALIRYNFVQEECVFVPYIQVGGGFVLNDAWKTPYPKQSLIGEQFEFLLRSEVGVRYMVTEAISLDIEAGFQHISNAGLGTHNGGINDFGGAVGVTYFFGRVR